MPNRPSLNLIIVVFSFLCSGANAQDWMRYGFDDIVLFKIPGQPVVKDTLGQRVLTIDTESGRIVALVLKDNETRIADVNEANKYYNDFLIGYSRSAKHEILSQQPDTLRKLNCMAFTMRLQESQVQGICKLIWIDHHVYLFEYLYNEDNYDAALNDSQKFFDSIEFASPSADHQFNNLDQLYTVIGFLSLGAIVLFGLGAIVTVVVLVYVMRKRAKAGVG